MGTDEAEYTDVLELDLGTVEPSLAGPRRPQDRVALSQVPGGFDRELEALQGHGGKIQPRATTVGRWEGEGGNAAGTAVAEPDLDHGVDVEYRGERFRLRHGAVVIAAITCCTNTSNPSVMMAAGLLAKKAVERGLATQAVGEDDASRRARRWSPSYLDEAGLTPYLEQLGFHLVGYGCTTCIGNSGPLPEPIRAGIEEGRLVGGGGALRQPQLRGAHPPRGARQLPRLAAAGRRLRARRPHRHRPADGAARHRQRRPARLPARHLADAAGGRRRCCARRSRSEMFHREYADVFAGDERWRGLPVPAGETYAWDPASTYVKHPPYFEGMTLQPPPVEPIRGARVLALLGDCVTTDHISPAGAIKPRARPGSTSSSTAWRRATSTPTARGAATTR